jgi:hypothetical protein
VNRFLTTQHEAYRLVRIATPTGQFLSADGTRYDVVKVAS